MTKAKRIFAFTALLLTAVLILPCFVGCSETPTEKDNPGMLTYDYDFLHGAIYSSYYPIHVTLTLYRNVEFDCKAIGYPYSFDNDLKEKNAKSGETIDLYAAYNANKHYPEFVSVDAPDGYFTIIARKSDHIVGYAVLLLKGVRLETDSNINRWRLEVLKTVEFPRAIGIFYQNISEEYVQEQIEKCMSQD